MKRQRLVLAARGSLHPMGLGLFVFSMTVHAQTTVTLGQGATAKNPYDVAIGANASASGDGFPVNMAIAVGSGAQATRAGSIAIGDAWSGGVKASGRDSIAIGTGTAASEQSGVAIGMGANASQANAVALGSGASTAAATGTRSMVINGVTYQFAGSSPLSTVSVGDLGSERTITNVAAGRLSASSTDAVNGSQLFAVGQAVSAVGSQVTSLGASVAASLGGASTYNGATGQVSTSLSYGGTTYHSVQAVLDQMTATPQTTSAPYFRANSTLADASPLGNDSVAIGPQATAGLANAVALGNGATATSNIGDVALGSGSTTSQVVATSGANIGGQSYAFAGASPTSTVSIGAAGQERTITNVAAGRLDASSTDAVNGSQLDATNQQVNANTVAISQLSHTVSTISSGGAGSKYLQVNSTGAASAATGANAIAVGSGATATGDQSVAQGQEATAAGQGSLALGNGARATGVNSVALGAGADDDGQANVVAVGSSTQQRRLTNVAAGTQATDAVNVEQLNATQAGTLHYDPSPTGTPNRNSVTLEGEGAGTQIHRVASGTAAGDAVNLGQMNAGIQGAQDWAKNYTDQRIDAVSQSLHTVAARANAGVASAVAMAGLPQAYQPNQNAAAIAFGTFRGEASVAVGVSSISGGGRWVYKLNLSGNTRGDAAASVGAATTW